MEVMKFEKKKTIFVYDSHFFFKLANALEENFLLCIV